MELFGIGAPELVLILVIVMIVFGPDQLPEIAKKLGTGIREIRHTVDQITTEVNATQDLTRPPQKKSSAPVPIPAAQIAPSNAVQSNVLYEDDKPPEPAAESAEAGEHPQGSAAEALNGADSHQSDPDQSLSSESTKE